MSGGLPAAVTGPGLLIQDRESAVWRIPSQCELRWRQFDDQFIVYADGPGDTHLVNEFGLTVLQILAETPINLPDLAEQVSRRLGLEKDNEVLRSVDGLISSLSGSGLVERVTE